MRSDIELEGSVRWAEDLSQEHLRTVLWLVGELRVRGIAVLGLLRAPWTPPGTERECRGAFERLERLWHVPPDGAAGVSPALPVISDKLRQQLPIGKYTRWAIDLSDADLHRILANIGSFAEEADALFELLCTNANASMEDGRLWLVRGSFALKSLVEMARGQRYSVGEFCVLLNRQLDRLWPWIADESPTCDFDFGVEQ